MYDTGKILTGLIVFLGLITSPIWYNVVIGEAGYKPDPKLPAKEKACVAPTEEIIASHMTLLNDWRDEVVRDGNRLYVSQSGTRYDMSLSEGCMKCHPNKAEFCDQCHNYVDVAPYCWDCHVEPKAKAGGE